MDITVRGHRNELLLENSSEFRQEQKRWTTLFTPLALIPIPGESDMPKVVGLINSQTKAYQVGMQLLRRSVVNSIVKTLNDSDMQKMVASYKRIKRLAKANRRLEERLLKGNASPAVDKAAAKVPLVLMPLRVSGVAAANRRAMEAAVASGLSERYKVYFGKRVADKVRQIYTKLTAKTEAGKECDETMCMQDIGTSFKTELVAIANVVKKPSGYLLTLNITNVFDDVLVMSESVPCKGCDEFKVIDRLKTLSVI